jgi:hypothetical protein
MICLAPAAFFRIEGTLTSLDLALTLALERNAITWSSPVVPMVFDVLRGDLEILRETAGSFELATDYCLADDISDGTFPYDDTPPQGKGFWFLVRPVTSGGGTYDADGPNQMHDRDEPIALSGRDCS